MKTRLQSLWESIRSSFWFFPGLIALAGIGLAHEMVRLDRLVSLETTRYVEYMFPGGAEGARLVLSTIAGSTITVVGVSFSITIAALAMASSQFGPRLLRSFMADKGNQIVLGTFVGTFIYSLIVLRTIRDDGDTLFIPEIAITFAIILALVSFGILIYFFHHVSSSIQAEQVVDTIYRELIIEIDRTFPPESAVPSHPAQDARDTETPAAVVLADVSGYLRAVDVESLLSSAIDHDLMIRLQYRPGDFVFEKTPLALVCGREGTDGSVHKEVRQAFVLGKYRSLEQDVEFPIQQLVDMALRALSPALNDPYTAVNCIDRLGAALCHLSDRQPPPARRYDDAGRLRLILDVPTYEGIVDAAFNLIRQSAANNVAASIRLLEALQAIAVTTSGEDRRKVIRLHAEMVHRAAQDVLTEQKDRNDLEKRFREVMQKLGAAGS